MMMTPEQTQIIIKVESIVQARLEHQGAGHGFDHVQRVLKSARLIQSSVGGDLFVIELASLLHDVGDAKFHEGVERSAEFSNQILEQLQIEPDCIAHVAKIVDNISFRKRDQAENLTLEGKIVQDADRLDALGAIGIVRTIEFGAAFDQPFYLPGVTDQKTGVDHFHDKLFKLRGLMNTTAGKNLAENREHFMRTFLQQYLTEYDATEKEL